jgi:pyruvate/2-oxoglutarate dehydrogenase complex dihydrolipoamide dehydrogenase (E3) component
VVTAHDILANKVVAGQQAAVIGGGATGCETANYLGAHGKKVTLVEALPAIGAGEQPVRMIWLKNSLNRFGIRIETNAEVEAIDASGALHISRNGQKECLGTFDTIVMAVGVRCHDPISPGIMKAMPEVHVVGDAFAMPTNGLDALHHAAKIARRI